MGYIKFVTSLFRLNYSVPIIAEIPKLDIPSLKADSKILGKKETFAEKLR